MPTLTQLEYIVAVHRLKHFGRAASECHVSQPSLSAQIQKVEEILDIVIFDRSKKPITTTDVGLRFIEQAQVVLREHKQLFDIAEGVEGELSGNFHLGVIPTLAPYVIPLFVKSFAENFPHVHLQISEFQTKDIIDKLYNDEIDSGLLVTPLYDDKIAEKPLFYEPFYGFVSADNPLSKNKRIKESQLDLDSLLLLNEGHCFRDQVLRLCSSTNRSTRRSIQFESGNLETLINIVRRGEGVTLLPHLATLQLSTNEKRDMLKAFTQPIPTREVSLVFSRRHLKKDIIEALSKEIQSHIPKELALTKKASLEVIDI